jgi:hypothetical protein
MYTLEHDLRRLLVAKVITRETAMSVTLHPAELER